MRGRKTVRRVRHETLGELDIPGMPVKFSDWPDRIDVKASRVGEDNGAVLREMLAISDDELAALHDEGVLLRGGPADETKVAAGNVVIESHRD
jgi:crotonobetainyl-CoA:carnitine CoA-transferase CaiB-like acyl-CoA transferase